MPKNKLSCPRNVKDCGPSLRDRLRDRINEGIDRRETRRTERKTKKEEKNAPVTFKGTLGKSEPPKLAVDYTNDANKPTAPNGNKTSRQGRQEAREKIKVVNTTTAKAVGMKGRVNPYSI
jgi:hypothetical protein